jgi:Carbohydrate-selective porin, OprB family/S-layer homology domain
MSIVRINRTLLYGVVTSVAALWLLSANGQVIAEPKNEANIFNEQNKNNLKLNNRQENFVDYLDYLDQSDSPTDPLHNLISQTRTIEEISDIQPTDWSYQALRNLIERYGCISGFEERSNGQGLVKTFRGEQTLSRAEFAAGLNSCLNNIEKIIARTKDVPQTDIDTVLRLMQEFQSELAILQGRTDGSQARLLDLEATQFSTTSKLQGEAVLGLGGVLTSSDNDRPSAILGSRLRLDLKTSFQGNDLLFTRLSRWDFAGFASELGTFQGELAFAEPDGDDFRLEDLHYSFGLGDRLNFIVGAAGVDADDIAPTVNYLDGDGGSGAVSTFGTRNPLYYPPADAGLGVNYRPIDPVQISAGYVASTANEPTTGNGLFNGPYSALGQITLEPLKNLSLAATYIHNYNQSDTATGTSASNVQSQTEALFGTKVSTVSNSYGLELSWTISDRLILGGWGGLSKVSSLNTLNQQLDRGTQNIWNWAATLAIPDLGKEGNLGGIVLGSEPTVTSSTSDSLAADQDRSLHLEAFYQYQVNNNIAITPGVIWITEPDSNTVDLEDLVIGTVRTTFSF